MYMPIYIACTMNNVKHIIINRLPMHFTVFPISHHMISITYIDQKIKICLWLSNVGYVILYMQGIFLHNEKLSRSRVAVIGLSDWLGRSWGNLVTV